MTTTIAEAPAHERWVAAFETIESQMGGSHPQSLRELRQRAFSRFAALGYPTTKLEEWRSTNVGPIARTEFVSPGTTAGVTEGDLQRFQYEGCAQIVLVNGRFVPELSDLEGLPREVVVTHLGDALERHPEKVEKWLGRQARFDEHAFVALNTAFHRDGAFIWVPRNLVVERPINIISLARTEADPVAFFPRHLVVAEESSQITLVEQYGTVGSGNYLVSPVTEVEVAANATVDHYKLQRESDEAFHMATLQVHLDRDANFSSHSISWGGGIVRNDVNAVLAGEGCEATLNGLYMVEGTQLVDNHMRVDHVAAHCDSHELYKGILEGRSRAVFSGRIYVHPGAQKTDAKQTNRNLLLSADALCNSNPQLEIFADDVKCTHGSTVGQLDDTAVFYLRSRGIGEVAARSLLTYAFAADIVERIKVAPVRRDLEEFLFRRLPKGDVVRQAV